MVHQFIAGVRCQRVNKVCCLGAQNRACLAAVEFLSPKRYHSISGEWILHNWLERYFQLATHGTTVRKELIAGATTFLAMAYITVVNPAILSEAGMDFGAVFVATCIAAAIGSGLMGLAANYPIGLAPGMGQNAFFTYAIVITSGYAWQTALGAVFLSGVLFLILTILPVREWLINSIPRNLKLGMAAGIGLFLALIAMQNAGLVVDNPATLVGFGDLKSFSPAAAIVGFGFLVPPSSKALLVAHHLWHRCLCSSTLPAH